MTVDRATMIIFIAGILCLVCAAVIALADHHYRKRSLKRMYDMIQSAMDGAFRADTYDESLYAVVENKLAEYIDASEILKAKTAAEKALIETLIADISHQTKTPIANILLYTELIKEQEESERNWENLELLESQAKKLNFLVQSLLKLSRLETGILALRPEESSVSELLQDAGRQYAGAAREKGLYLRVMSEDAQGITACFDGKWTMEALGNLIDNAIKYTAAGGVTLRVRKYELFVCIEVEDTGMGIAEEEHAKIYGRFYRSPKAAGQAGVGIGLYLAREILRQESGYMKLVSKEGKGSVFSMYLPVNGPRSGKAG